MSKVERSTSFLWGFLVVALLVGLSHQPSFPVSYVYLNGESYLEVEIPDTVSLTADCAQPGNRLKGEIFLDLNENGGVDGGEPLVQFVYINDGIPTVENEEGDEIPGDDDAQANGQVLHYMDLLEEDIKITSTPVQLILRITDEDASWAQAMLRIIPPTVARPCIGGTVIDASTAAPLDTIVVMAEEVVTQEVKVTLTDEEGRYVLKLQAGTWQVFAGEPFGYYAPSDTQVAALGADDSTVVGIVLSPYPCFVTGKVDSTGGKPVPGITVMAMSSGFDSYVSHTGADGSYRIGLFPETYDVYPLFLPSGYATWPPNRRNVGVDSGATFENQNFSLMRSTCHIEGRVTYEAGGSAGEVTVSAFTSGGYRYATTTDLEGNYFLTMLPAAYFLSAEREGYEVISPLPGFYLGVTINYDQTLTGYDFVIAPSGGEPLSISGTVTYKATGDFASDVYVVIYNDQEDSPLGWGFAETDGNGHYEFADIPAGTWLIGAYQPGYSSDPPLREQILFFGGPPATEQDFQLMPGTGIPHGPEATVPKGFCLFQNRPNPFNAGTLIAFTLSDVESERVTLRIFNVLGQEVRTLVNGYQRAGLHLVRWDGCDHLGCRVASGIYLCELRAGGERQTRKMVLLR